MSKVVQENFGEAIINAVSLFAKNDLTTVEELKNNHFAHVGDAHLRNILAETFYGARWIYKLGLALLVKDAEQMAHVRTQVMDYSAVCEGLLSDVLFHALVSGKMTGNKYKFSDTKNLKKPINWQVQNHLSQLSKQSFFWLIEVAREEKIIEKKLYDNLHDMRKERNTVHMRARTHKAFVGTSKSLFDVAISTINRTKNWKIANP